LAVSRCSRHEFEHWI